MGSRRMICAMLARESDLDLDNVDASLEVEAPHDVAHEPVTEEAPAPATDAELSAQGPIPEVTETGLVVEPGRTASEQAFGDAAVVSTGVIGAGMYEPDDYQAACVAAGTPDKWDDRYAQGHTSAPQWTQPYDGLEDMSFHLKPGESASQAVKSFILGPTVADYLVISVANEMDELRDDLGDPKFDLLFGSADSVTDAQIPVSQRLKLNDGMWGIPFYDQMKAIAADYDTAQAASELEAPAVAAQLEETPTQEELSEQPSPERVAEELGVHRDLEVA